MSRLPRPIMEFSSADAFDPDGRVVWWARLQPLHDPYARIQVEVVRTKPYRARLSVFNRDSDTLVANVAVHLGSDKRKQANITGPVEWLQLAETLMAEGICVRSERPVVTS